MALALCRRKTTGISYTLYARTHTTSAILIEWNQRITNRLAGSDFNSFFIIIFVTIILLSVFRLNFIFY